MLFPTHLVAGYALGARADLPPFWALAGAALPDLVDKPLAMAGAVDPYHSVGHSLLVFLLVALATALPGAPVGRRDEAAAAVAVGWASHLLLDAVHLVVNGRPGDLTFLLWPVAGAEAGLRLPPVEFLAYYLWSPSFFLETAVWLAAALHLLGDGRRGG